MSEADHPHPATIDTVLSGPRRGDRRRVVRCRRHLPRRLAHGPEPWLDHLALDIPADLAAAVAADPARQPLRAAVAVVVAVASNTRRYR